ncbi:MAG: PrkA family serine protein kinase [Bdellovibrionota bacterium]
MSKGADQIHKSIKEEYENQNRILSYDEYLDLVRAEPVKQVRSSAQYVTDMMDFFGREGSDSGSPKARRFKVFDQEFADARFRLVGQEAVQENIYHILKSFIREGVNNKLVLLHGPNGSAKSSIINCLMRGLEEYSQRPDGAVYRFHWVFPVDRHGKAGLGLGRDGASKDDDLTSYAKLPDTEIAARISCELRDHPLFLVPLRQRAKLLQELNLPKDFIQSEYVQKGDLSQKSKKIFEALLRSHKGDYRKVLRYVQVERFYISKRYRDAAVTIEPQMHVDATAQQITMDRSASMLPSSLQFLTLFDLHGDLVDGNRGIVEYNDLLKRPIDAFKYLLTTTETGTVSIGGTTAFIDSLLIGTCNEAQLDAFKEYPDFPSFRARIELVRVPYLLDYKKETEIYKTQVRRLAGDRHVAPHTLESAALWAVLCRLKKPNASHYPGNFAYLVNSITPAEKSRLLAEGIMPTRLSSEERKLLKSHIDDIRAEYAGVPYYEGRIGPSPREMKIILFNALERNDKGILSPLGLFAELEDFVKRTSEYDYLREDVVEGYHDCRAFIQTSRDTYLDNLDTEVRSCLGVHDDNQYAAFLRKYIMNVTAHLKKEKIRNPVTDRLEAADPTLMDEFEIVVGVLEDREHFRQNIMTQLGVYALENPEAGREGMVYSRVFPDLMKRIRDFYIDEHSQLMKRVFDVITLFEQRGGAPLLDQGRTRTVEQIDAEKIALSMVDNMKRKFGYNDISAREAFVYLFQKRY